MNHPREAGDTARSSGPRSAWLGWTLALLAVPVLYVLTFPPIAIASFHLRGYAGASWVGVYSVPYAWAGEYTPLREPLRWYAEWWVSITGFEPP